ncbi:MAG: MATE family efflux transporter [Bacteroidales bacterium]
MGKDSKRFLKGVASGYAFMITSLIVSLWLVPFTLKYLTKPEYAIFAIAGDLLTWLGLAGLGVSSVFNSRGAQLIGKGDKEELNILASTTFFTQLTSAIIIILAGIVVTLKPELLFSKEASAEHLQLVVAILVMSFTISFILQPLNSMLVASKQIHIDNYLRFGLLAINTALTVFFLMHGLKLLSLAVSNFIGTVIISIITWIRVKRTLGYVKIDLGLWRFDRFRFLLKNGIWFSIGGLAGIFIFRMDSFLIGQYISLTTVTSYVITIKLYQVADKFHGQFFNTTRPYFAQIYGKGDLGLLSRMHSLSFNLAFTAAFIMGLVIMLVNKWFIGIWVGPDFYLGDTINMLLCFNFILQASVLPNRIVLASTFYMIEWHNITRVTEGALKLVVSILLFKSVGVNAVVIGSIIACLLFSSIFLNYLTSRLLNENFWNKIRLLLLTLSILAVFYLTDGNYLRILLYAALIIIVAVIFVLRENKNLRLIYSKLPGFNKLNANESTFTEEG